MVTHDLGIVAKICDRAAVMYAGKIVESAKIRDLFNNPTHPYTIALLKSLPKMEDSVKRLYSIPGQPPNVLNMGPGCSFAPRCQHVLQICKETYPPQSEMSDEHTVSCWLAEN
jgi:peptide/nickel transport system ATP-binding protein